MPREPQVLVCDVQRFSLHDGPGIRTTVFFKGCPLACRWCHNPEAIAFGNEPLHAASDCIRCGDCVEACVAGALRMTGSGVQIDHARCDRCMRCTEVCPSGAWRAAARRYSVDGLLEEVLRDRDFYGSDGGVTLSGGEPLVHAGFLRRFLERTSEHGVHITAQTAGHFEWRRIEPLLEHIDRVHFDLKVVAPERHRSLTGRDNGRILRNLSRLVARGCNVELRMPVVIGFNDDADNLRRSARVARGLGLRSITLLAYHPLGEAKLDKLASELRPLGARAAARADLDRAAASFATHGIAVRRHDDLDRDHAGLMSRPSVRPVEA
jgi:pyruvate formate lyase activating enzyme